MFTGIIREIGVIEAVVRKGAIFEYSIHAEITSQAVNIGSSVSVDGVCQTVVVAKEGRMIFHAVEETVKKTTLAKITPGRRVHLEPALKMGGALDGHLVYGHVDGVGRVIRKSEISGRYNLGFRVNPGLDKYLISSGSVCLNGVSLTLFKVQGAEGNVTLIPETLRSTLLGEIKIGDEINVEVDIIGKWMEKLILSGTLRNTNALRESLDSMGS
ncbi:MAG: riboflavin synthase [Planctomycetes bacterium]|nr:riboflavin synthase [Planctomycetota bacterium]